MFRQLFWLILRFRYYFNNHKTYYIVEEILDVGFIQESDKKSIIKNLKLQDRQLYEEKEIEYNTNNK